MIDIIQKEGVDNVRFCIFKPGLKPDFYVLDKNLNIIYISKESPAAGGGYVDKIGVSVKDSGYTFYNFDDLTKDVDYEKILIEIDITKEKYPEYFI